MLTILSEGSKFVDDPPGDSISGSTTKATSLGRFYLGPSFLKENSSCRSAPSQSSARHEQRQTEKPVRSDSLVRLFCQHVRVAPLFAVCTFASLSQRREELRSRPDHTFRMLSMRADGSTNARQSQRPEQWSPPQRANGPVHKETFSSLPVMQERWRDTKAESLPKPL